VAASLKERMRSGTPALGCWLNLFDTLVAEIIGSAGYDFAMIDLEHGPGSVMEAVRVMQALGEDCVPYARVPANDPVWIKRVLDAGVQGVMVPSVNDAADAAAAVGACHYAPRGSRGMAATIVRASNFGADWEAYVERIEREVLVICQIESQGAVENVEAIAATEGLDMLFVGPFDLSASLGYLGQPDHREVREAIGRIEAAAKSAEALLGGISTPGRTSGELLAQGYDLILPDGDVALLRDGARASVRALRSDREAAGQGSDR